MMIKIMVMKKTVKDSGNDNQSMYAVMKMN